MPLFCPVPDHHHQAQAHPVQSIIINQFPSIESSSAQPLRSTMVEMGNKEKGGPTFWRKLPNGQSPIVLLSRPSVLYPSFLRSFPFPQLIVGQEARVNENRYKQLN